MIFRLLLISAIFLWFPSAYKRWTHSFRPAKCILSWPYNPDWDAEPDASIRDILKEPFTYLSKGAQSYVFLSNDQKYVLKLFRFDACRIQLGQKLKKKFRKWTGMRGKHELPLDVKARKTLSSCKISYDLASDLTGVVWVHLNPQPTDLPMISLKDRLGRTHRIDPSKYRFALQKKADSFLQTILKAEDPAPLIDSYLSLISKLSERGIANLDPTMGRNFGFIDGQAIEIDFGNFALDSSRAERDRIHFEKRLVKWLEKKRPDAAGYVQERVER
jgi:hypothetical protein